MANKLIYLYNYMYKWITILLLLIFFIIISVKNKECFSVGGGDESNNINISSNLYLTDVCHKGKKLDGETCKIDDNCNSGFCFYKFNDKLEKTDYNENGVNGSCININIDKPNASDNQLCIPRNINEDKFGPLYIQSIYKNALFQTDTRVSPEKKTNIKKLLNSNFKNYNNEFFCKEDSVCSDKLIPDMKDVDNTSDLYNICSNLKEIVSDFDTDIGNFDSDVDKINLICKKYLGTGICEYVNKLRNSP
jgi:hypothetical protein